MGDARRLVPRTDAVLADPRLAVAAERLGRALVREAVHGAQQRARDGAIDPQQVTEAAIAALPPLAAAVTPVLNGTGVLVHGGLGRAPLSAAARAALAVAAGCTDLEYDLASGTSGRRTAAALAAIARAVPGAQAVQVVSNGTAGLVLAAVALAAGREIVASRGELPGFGGEAGLAGLLGGTGASLRAVGAAAGAAAGEYAAAVGQRTGFLLTVRGSDGTDAGVVRPRITELRDLGAPVVAVVRSGLLAPHPALPGMPDVATCLRDGADLGIVSADSLLGGPQAGLLLGRAELIAALARHPLARALRLSKLTAAALAATLTGPQGPVPSALDAAGTDAAGPAARARRLAQSLATAGVDARPVASRAVACLGGPELASAAVSLPAELAGPLRSVGQDRAGRWPAVVGVLSGDRLLVDLCAIDPADDEALAGAVLAALEAGRGRDGGLEHR